MRVVNVHNVQNRTCAHCAALTADRRVFRMKDAQGVPLTYSVPFLVVTFGALANAAERLRAGPQDAGPPQSPSRD